MKTHPYLIHTLSILSYGKQVKESTASYELFAVTFSEWSIVLPTKFNLLFHLNLMNLRSFILDSNSDKLKLFAEIFSENSILDYKDRFLPAFSSSTYQKECTFYVIHKKVMKVIAALDSYKAFSPDCTPVVVLKDLIFQLH